MSKEVFEQAARAFADLGQAMAGASEALQKIAEYIHSVPTQKFVAIETPCSNDREGCLDCGSCDNGLVAEDVPSVGEQLKEIVSTSDPEVPLSTRELRQNELEEFPKKELQELARKYGYDPADVASASKDVLIAGILQEEFDVYDAENGDGELTREMILGMGLAAAKQIARDRGISTSKLIGADVDTIADLLLSMEQSGEDDCEVEVPKCEVSDKADEVEKASEKVAQAEVSKPANGLYTEEYLSGLTEQGLKDLARGMGIKWRGTPKRGTLVDKILDAQ